MKFKTFNAGIVVCALAVSLSGCSKSEPPAPTAPDAQKPQATATTEAQPAVSAPAAETAPAEAKPAVETTAAPAAPAVEKATTTAASAVDTVTAQAQTLIDKAKSLVDAKKYQEAMDIINQLSTLKLSTEQQKLVDDLKAQVQKLMADQVVPNAADTVGNVLGK
jgi:hypothetical protein